LPLWDEFDFEADLMVFEPQQVVDNWVVAGAKRVILHIESVKDFGALLSTLRGSYPRAGADSIGIEIGVALNPDTPNESIYPFLDELDFVQFMGIQKIGYQGQKFDERVLGKIAELRAKYPQCIISVDGAVSTETAPRLMKAGANRLAVGSAIFANESPRQAIEQLQSLEY
jgi:ribulose-phosphate 3-epimerase